MRQSGSRSPRAAGNVLLLVHTFADPGGTQKVVCEVGRLLAERYRVFECSFDAHREERVFENGNTVFSLGVPPPESMVERFVGYVLKAYRLNRIKKRYEIDVTISNLWPADFINALSGGRGRRIAIGHHPIIGDLQNRMMLKHIGVVRWAYRRFEKIVAVNESLMREMQTLFRLPDDRMACIHNFIAVPDRRGVEVKRMGKRRKIAWFGRLTETKNLRPMFDILREVRRTACDVQLVVIGVGPEESALLDAASGKGLRVSRNADDETADVLFLGFVEDPSVHLRSALCLVVTSRAEGFGLVILEALSLGLPVLAGDCPNGGPHTLLGGAGRFEPGRGAAEETSCGVLLPVPELSEPSTLTPWIGAIHNVLNEPNVWAEKSEACRRRAAIFSRETARNRWFALMEAA